MNYPHAVLAHIRGDGGLLWRKRCPIDLVKITHDPCETNDFKGKARSFRLSYSSQPN